MLLALMAVAAPAFAQFGPPPATEYQAADNPWYVSPMFDYVGDYDGRNSQDGVGGSVYLGKFLDRHFAAELGYFGHGFHHSVFRGPSYREQGAELSGLFFFSRQWVVQPYVTVGADYVHTNRLDLHEEGNNFAWDAGLGVMVPFKFFGYPIALRADARDRFLKVGSRIIENTSGSTTQNSNGQFNEPIFRVGLVIPLCVKKVVAAAPPKAAPAPPAPVARALPPPVVVEEEGTKFEDVHFPYNKSSLTDKAKASLDSDAKAIGTMVKKNPKTAVEVAGHTDWIGSDAYNQALSERRAQSVKDYLVRKGVDGQRVTTQAFGESKPVADNRTDEGRALNRRAEIRAH